MMAERRCGQVDVRLDVSCGGAVGTGLHHESQDPQAHGVAESAQLLCVTLQFRAHPFTSNILEREHKGYFENYGSRSGANVGPPRGLEHLDFLRPAARHVVFVAMTTREDDLLDVARHATTITDYWFATLDDGSRLDRAAEPFRTCYQRWYGKDPAVDADIKARFEPVLLDTTRDGRRLDDVILAFREKPRGPLSRAVGR